MDSTRPQLGGQYGQNLCILSRKTGKLEMVHLPNTSQSGPPYLQLFGWLKGSTPEADSLVLTYTSFRGIVVLPSKTLVPIPAIPSQGPVNLKQIRFSPDRRHYVTDGRLYPFNIFIDGVDLKFVDTVQGVFWFSWSPDSKKLAVTSLNSGNKSYSFGGIIWIIDVEKWDKERPAIVPVEKIDIQKRFCMYAFGDALKAEFTSNTTLAVNMHHDGDMLQTLWEITTDGRLLRQLTKR